MTLQPLNKEALSKIPEVTLAFWIIKIAATTLGQTCGDTITMTLNWGYLVGTALFLGLLFVLVTAQVLAKIVSPHPLLGDNCRLDDFRHDNGQFHRSFARDRLHRGFAVAFRVFVGRAWRVVLVGRHHLRKYGQHAEGRGVLLGGDHVFTDARYGARRLARRYWRPGLRRQRAGKAAQNSMTRETLVQK